MLAVAVGCSSHKVLKVRSNSSVGLGTATHHASLAVLVEMVWSWAVVEWTEASSIVVRALRTGGAVPRASTAAAALTAVPGPLASTWALIGIVVFLEDEIAQLPHDVVGRWRVKQSCDQRASMTLALLTILLVYLDLSSGLFGVVAILKTKSKSLKWGFKEDRLTEMSI